VSSRPYPADKQRRDRVKAALRAAKALNVATTVDDLLLKDFIGGEEGLTRYTREKMARLISESIVESVPMTSEPEELFGTPATRFKLCAYLLTPEQFTELTAAIAAVLAWSEGGESAS